MTYIFIILTFIYLYLFVVSGRGEGERSLLAPIQTMDKEVYKTDGHESSRHKIRSLHKDSRGVLIYKRIKFWSELFPSRLKDKQSI